MENKTKKEINKCLASVRDYADMQSVCRLHSLTGGVFRHIALKYLGNSQDANGGYIDVDGNGRVEFVDSVKEYESGTYVSLPILSKKMYTFEGWYMVVDGREINVGSGVNVVADMTVIAKWSGGPDYPDYTIPEEYHGVYISQSDPNVTLEVESDKIKCTIDGASDYYYPTIIDGKVKMYMDNYYIDMLVDVSFGEGAMVTTFGEQVSVFVKVN